ncbi:ABC transporter ATP-binding protein [Pseudonocardia acidicola]|uniref:ABC transporter ATP-binding protein n=1 Tax=Pseudonocardia acidicola TaxID=2724939 RepID=UPI0030841C67
MTVLRVSGLAAHAGAAPLLAATDLELAAGEVVAVVGESGCGKTTLGLGLLGEHAAGVRLTGSVRLGADGAELVGPADRELRARRAGRVGYLPQQPASALHPGRRIGGVLGELARLVHPTRAQRRAAVAAALRAAHLPADRALLRRYPHQLSGGQQQRVALAQALVTRPGVLVLDEPTTGLDTVTRARALAELGELVAGGTTLVLLTHDLAAVRLLADRVVVLDRGRVVEQGPAAGVLAAPAHPATRRIVAAEPRLRTGSAGRAGAPPRLQASGLRVQLRSGAILLDGVDLAAEAGEVVAVVGRSGAGKTTLARCLAGLVVPTAGQVQVDGTVLAADARRRRRAGLHAVQYVHQDARASFVAHRSVTAQLARTAQLLRGVPAAAAREEARELLAALGIDGAAADRRPAGLSGGQLQRAAVVRALLARPAVLVCDEITSALDTHRQAELLAAITAPAVLAGAAVVLISHDLALVSGVADSVCVIDEGRCAEHRPTRQLLAEPRTGPTRALLAAAATTGAVVADHRGENTP